MRLRSLVWLFAFLALVLPPSTGPTVAMATNVHGITGDCDHAPPPPCPEKDNAKHAAGLCCPMMAQVVATMPAQVGASDFPARDRSAVATTARYTGLSPHKDPPPPRA